MRPAFLRPAFLRTAFHRLAPVARRDAKIADLRRRVARLRSEKAALQTDLDDSQVRVRRELASHPSFQARIHEERRLTALARALGAPPRSVIQGGKLDVYELARSHGVEPPTEFGRWDDPADIAWDDLPDHVVIKSAFSTHARGVFPLRRTELGWQVIAGTQTLTDEQLTAALTARIEKDEARPPFVAEEFLDEDGTGTRLPTDVKLYAFYGEVLMVVLRRPTIHQGHPSTTTFRVIDAKGHDFTDFDTVSSIDMTLPIPVCLEEAVAAAKRLSLAIRRPFARLDFYCIGDRVVFGEVTPRPGGSNWHGPSIDAMLGDAWERALTRLARDASDLTAGW